MECIDERASLEKWYFKTGIFLEKGGFLMAQIIGSLVLVFCFPLALSCLSLKLNNQSSKYISNGRLQIKLLKARFDS